MTFVFIVEDKPLEDFKYSMVVVDSEGKEIFESPESRGQTGPSGRGHLSVNVMGLKFPKEGVYTAKFDIGGKKEEISLDVNKSQNK
jgi:hypothetical protein